MEFQGYHGIASDPARRFLWMVNRLRNSDSGNDLSQLSDQIGIAPFRIVRPKMTVPLSEGSPVRGIVRCLGISEEQTCVRSKDIPGRIDSSSGDLHRGN